MSDRHSALAKFFDELAALAKTGRKILEQQYADELERRAARERITGDKPMKVRRGAR